MKSSRLNSTRDRRAVHAASSRRSCLRHRTRVFGCDRAGSAPMAIGGRTTCSFTTMQAAPNVGDPVWYSSRCSARNRCRRSASAGLGSRPMRQQERAYSSRSAVRRAALPCRTRFASARANSTNASSFSRVSACSGCRNGRGACRSTWRPARRTAPARDAATSGRRTCTGPGGSGPDRSRSATCFTCVTHARLPESAGTRSGRR